MSKTLSQITEEIVSIFDEHRKQGTLDWDYEIASRDLIYQVGSLNKAILQLKNHRYRDGKTDAELKEVVADELADILAEVAFIANDMGINLETAWEKMAESDRKKIRERSIQ